MSKISWKPGNMIYPLPAVMVSCGAEGEPDNIITVAWTGTICTNPPMTYISLRPQRHSYHMIEKSGEFVINLTTAELAKATDFCGVRSGRDVDKFSEMKLTPAVVEGVDAPAIAESPLNLACKVTQIIPLGSHEMFLAKIVSVTVDEQYMDENGSFHLNDAGLVAYSHGTYFQLGEALGSFGYSVKKRDRKGKKKAGGKKNKR